MTPKQIHSAIEACAAAAHDEMYDINAETSDMAYMFEDEQCKKTWRRVAMAVLKAASDGGLE